VEQKSLEKGFIGDKT